MSLNLEQCPICSDNLRSFDATSYNMQNLLHVDCVNCGEYLIDQSAYNYEFKQATSKWTLPYRAAVSYFIRRRQNLELDESGRVPIVRSEFLESVLGGKFVGPNPSGALKNLIRFFGDQQRLTAEIPDYKAANLRAVAGVSTSLEVIDILSEMDDRALLKYATCETLNPDDRPFNKIRLGLGGWELWESIHRGLEHSRDGFIAMQFGDARLDKLVSDIIRPAIESELGVGLSRVDSPGTARAGLIDNVMRDAIESAAFILVDLSHGNQGAYWEAGLAEGLGKPVIYLCEQAVFDDPKRRPHFDVNHRTTIMWEEDKPDEFIKVLIPTIRTTLRHHYPDN